MPRRRDINCSMSPIARSERRNRPTDDRARRFSMSAFGTKADIMIALNHVCFWGNSGRWRFVTGSGAYTPGHPLNASTDPITNRGARCNFFIEFFGNEFLFLVGKYLGEGKKCPRHPHFISGWPAVCTGPSLAVAKSSRIIRRRHRSTFRNLLTMWKVGERSRANII